MPAALPKNKHFNRVLKLGRKPATMFQRMRTVSLKPYLKKAGATPPPDTVSYGDAAGKSIAQMLGNDQVGDCTIAAVMHEIGVASANAPGGTELVGSTAEATKQYESICGPGDQGCFIPDVLNYWRDKGMTVASKVTKSDGYASVDHTDQLAAKVAIYLFSGLHLGINLPRDWYESAAPGAVWDVTDSDIVGGHSIAICGYDADGIDVLTWGVKLRMTWAAFANPQWVDECYAVLPQAWYNEDGMSAHGIDVTALKAALAVVAGGGTPPLPDPTPTPVVPPTPPTPSAGGNLTASGFLEALGQQFPLSLTGNVGGASSSRAAVSWWPLVVDVAKLVSAIEAQDWVGAASAAEAVLSDLGISFNTDSLIAFTEAVKTARETSVLSNGKPPK